MGLFNNVFLLYVCITIACLFYQPQLVFTASEDSATILGFWDYGINATTNEPYLTSHSAYDNRTNEATARMLGEGREASQDNTPLGSIFITVIDVLFNIIKFIGLIFNILFAPVIILSHIGVPSYILFGLGLPLNFLGLISIVFIIRGYN